MFSMFGTTDHRFEGFFHAKVFQPIAMVFFGSSLQVLVGRLGFEVSFKILVPPNDRFMVSH